MIVPNHSYIGPFMANNDFNYLNNRYNNCFYILQLLIAQKLS